MDVLVVHISWQVIAREQMNKLSKKKETRISGKERKRRKPTKKKYVELSLQSASLFVETERAAKNSSTKNCICFRHHIKRKIFLKMRSVWGTLFQKKTRDHGMWISGNTVFDYGRACVMIKQRSSVHF